MPAVHKTPQNAMSYISKEQERRKSRKARILATPQEALHCDKYGGKKLRI